MHMPSRLTVFMAHQPQAKSDGIRGASLETKAGRAGIQRIGNTQGQWNQQRDESSWQRTHTSRETSLCL